MSEEIFEELSVKEFDDLIENFINWVDDRIVINLSFCNCGNLKKDVANRRAVWRICQW